MVDIDKPLRVGAGDYLFATRAKAQKLKAQFDPLRDAVFDSAGLNLQSMLNVADKAHKDNDTIMGTMNAVIVDVNITTARVAKMISLMRRYLFLFKHNRNMPQKGLLTLFRRAEDEDGDWETDFLQFEEIMKEFAGNGNRYQKQVAALGAYSHVGGMSDEKYEATIAREQSTIAKLTESVAPTPSREGLTEAGLRGRDPSVKVRNPFKFRRGGSSDSSRSGSTDASFTTNEGDSSDDEIGEFAIERERKILVHKQRLADIADARLLIQQQRKASHRNYKRARAELVMLKVLFYALERLRDPKLQAAIAKNNKIVPENEHGDFYYLVGFMAKCMAAGVGILFLMGLIAGIVYLFVMYGAIIIATVVGAIVALLAVLFLFGKPIMLVLKLIFHAKKTTADVREKLRMNPWIPVSMRKND
jgi:hypothetical protein